MKLKYLAIALIVIVAVSCKKDEDENVFKGQSISSPSFSGININTLAIDGGGVKWIGTSSGLYRYDGTDWHLYPDEPLNTTINHIFIETVSGGNNIIISTDRGAVVASVDGANLVPQATYTYSENGILSDSVNSSLVDSYDKNWFGTDSGLCYLQNDTWTRSLHRTLPQVRISSIAQIDTNYYVGTYGSWMYHIYYDEETDAVTGASQMIYPFSGDLTTRYTYCVYAGSDGYLWFGSEKGLTKQRDGTKVGYGEFEYFLDGEHVYSVIETGNGTVWAGTGNGVFSQSGVTWTQYTTSDGLSGNKVNALAEDIDGSIWAGASNGLSHFDGTNWVSY